MATYLQALNYCKKLATIHRNNFESYNEWNKTRNLRDRQLRRLRKHFADYEKNDTLLPCTTVGPFTVHLNGECDFRVLYRSVPPAEIYAAFFTFMIYARKLQMKTTGVTLET